MVCEEWNLRRGHPQGFRNFRFRRASLVAKQFESVVEDVENDVQADLAGRSRREQSPRLCIVILGLALRKSQRALPAKRLGLACMSQVGTFERES